MMGGRKVRWSQTGEYLYACCVTAPALLRSDSELLLTSPSRAAAAFRQHKLVPQAQDTALSLIGAGSTGIMMTPAQSHITSTQYSLVDLPLSTCGRFESFFLPTWLDSAGTVKNPWNVSDMIGGIQAVWDLVFPLVPYTVSHGDVVHSLVTS